ncbi:MAG: hypothetical protein K2J95_07015 [Lachnospiraceae bacterium]|nr:hypothetical protein [Lachnospiraceae bacterium]
MEEEKKELKQEFTAEEEKKVHKKVKKKILLLIPVFIVLGTGLFLVLRETGVINKYVYEEVDNLAEREGVCFDNLLFSYTITVNRGGQSEERLLCIFNNGDVYACEWTNNRSPWDFRYDGTEKISQDSSELHSRGYEEANWGKMENVVYLGRFSDSAVRRLNSYVDNFDINGKFYYLDPPPEATVPQGGGGQQERDDINEEGDKVVWESYGARLYWYRPSEKIRKKYFSNIEWCSMNPTWWGGYEKEILERSLDENAIAAIKLFESSGFYDRWVKMCLNGY